MDGLKAYTPSKDVEMMDREGVAVSMLSCTTPSVWFGDPAETRRMARPANISRVYRSAGSRRMSYALSIAKTRCEFCQDSRADDAKRFTVEPVSLPWAQRP